MTDAAPRCPALLIAAPASGQGKTLLTAALARLLARRGWRVRVFKCGPDFLDPFWHALASGAPVHNLDLWMTGEADIRARLTDAARQAEVLLVEGVMGLHDGQPSAAALARRFGLPVLAVVQAGAMAQTFGAIAHGLRHYRAAQDGALPWAGVLANGVASDGHAALLRQALDDPATWLGHIAKDAALQLPARHLGLVPAHELGATALTRLDAAADRLADTALGQMTLAQWRERFGVALAGPATPPPTPWQTPGAAQPLAGRVIAIARDAAFCFIYAANLQTLEALGARLAFFSPLAGQALPPCDAVWLPGGYPELHLPALTAHATLRQALHAHVAAGKPLWAECGGMMALADSVVDKTGQPDPGWGLLPGTARMGQRLAALGPQQWDAAPGRLPPLRGHTFHHSVLETALTAADTTHSPEGSPRTTTEAIYRHGSVLASYFHAWFASSPALVAALLDGTLQKTAQNPK